MEEKDLETEFETEYRLLRENGLKSNPLRLEYEEKVRDLVHLRERLFAENLSEKAIAETLHARRRELGLIYKEAAPPLFQEYIYAATAEKYGDPLGPSFAQLAQKKTYRQIIESASRPISDLDHRLTLDGFAAWFRKTKKQESNRSHLS